MLYIENRIRKSMGLPVRKGLEYDIAEIIADIIVDAFEKDGFPMGVVRTEFRNHVHRTLSNYHSSVFNSLKEICINLVSEAQSGGQATAIAEMIQIMLDTSRTPVKTIMTDGRIRYHWDYIDRSDVANVMEGAEILEVSTAKEVSFGVYSNVRFIPKGINAEIHALFRDRDEDDIQTRDEDLMKWAHRNYSGNNCEWVDLYIDPRSFRKSRRKVRKLDHYTTWFGAANALTEGLINNLVTVQACPAELVESRREDITVACRNLIEAIKPNLNTYINDVGKVEEDKRLIAMVEKLCGGEYSSSDTRVTTDTTYHWFDVDYAEDDRIWNGATRIQEIEWNAVNDLSFEIVFRLPGLDCELIAHACFEKGRSGKDKLEREFREAAESGNFSAAREIYDKHRGEIYTICLCVPRYSDSW